MNGRKLLQQTFGLTLSVLLLAACSGSSAEPTATLTPVPPTATPTPVPIECTLQCTIVKTLLKTEKDAKIYSITGLVMSGSDEFEIDGLQVDITCELGEASFQGDRSTKSSSEAITVSIDEERIYADTHRTYKIVGGFTYNQPSFNIIDYDLTVTGGIFSETPQTCKSP
jgi:hypothetical protein